MNTAQLLDEIRTARDEWEALLATLDEAQMIRPGVAGDWSVKDLIAHITWSEKEMVGMLKARALVGSELWNLPTDERNAAVFEENRYRRLTDVLAEAQQVYQQLMDAVKTLSDEELVDPDRFRGMPADWMPWQILAGSSFAHYREHARDVRAWLAKQEEGHV